MSDGWTPMTGKQAAERSRCVVCRCEIDGDGYLAIAGPRHWSCPDLDHYASLRRVLDMALEQAALGKGRERHAEEGQAFEDQPMVEIGERLGSNQYQLGQAIKKAYESVRLPRDRAIKELLGAINYLAGAVLVLEREGA